MHILMTTDTVGGVWTYCLELARALQPHGVQVSLAAKGNPTVDQVESATSLPNVSLWVGNYKLEWMNDPWEEVAAAGEWLLSLARQLRPDVIHLNEYCHGGLAWTAPTLIVGHSCVSSWMQAVRGHKPGAEWERYHAEVKHGINAADLVVAPTRSMLSSLCEHYGPLPRRQVIPNGCQPANCQLVGKQPFVFSAGRQWDEAKNLKTLAAAAPYVNWPIRVAGLPHPDAACEPVASEHVQWLGRLTPAEMAATYSEAAVYALPALYEPFGLTVLEAALAGCALVLGDIPTLRENWDGAAWFVAPRDAQGLAHALNRLADDEALRQRLAERAQERGQELSASRMAQAYCGAYRQLPKPARVAAVA